MQLSESTKRTIRTVVQALIAVAVSLPIVAVAVDGTPLAPTVATALAVLAVVTKVVNALEDAGIIPAWLKSTPAAPER